MGAPHWPNQRQNCFSGVLYGQLGIVHHRAPAVQAQILARLFQETLCDLEPVESTVDSSHCPDLHSSDQSSPGGRFQCQAISRPI